MRIIGGSHKGRILHPPQGLPVRPTTDLAKESLFNILNNHVDFESIKVLDLFAGTGNISLEFASRGAKQVISVDINGKCIDYISQTAKQLVFSNLNPVRANVFTFLARRSSPYDVVFADAPYDMEEREKIPVMVFENNWVAEDGFLIVEHDKKLDFKALPYFREERRYGKVHFSFFKNCEQSNLS